MNLRDKLANIFNDHGTHDRLEDMLYEQCEYDPDYHYETRDYDYKARKYSEPYMKHSPIDVGFAKWLLEEGIDFVVEDHHGGEGQGDSYWTVWKFVRFANGDEIEYVRFRGWYASYDGANYEYWEFTKPVEVMRREWE